MLRLFRSHPGYVAMSTFVLAIAVGVNLLVFTVVNALWIRPSPFPGPERIVTMPRDSGATTLDLPEYKIFEGRIAGQVFTAGQYEGLRPRIELAEAGRELETLGVTSGYFRLFGLTIRGRDFTLEDERDGPEPVAIISDRLWSNAFGRRTEVIATLLPAKPFPIRIIGVAPPSFEGARRGERTDMWIPISLARRLAPADWPNPTLGMMIFARLGPGQTLAMVNQRYRELMNPRDRAWILANNPLGLPTFVPLSDIFGTPATRSFIVSERDAALVVSGLAMLVLLGGCATIAALILVHYERRRGEFALKICLGAPRSRLVAELVRDLVLVAASGTAGSIVVAALGLWVIPALSLPGGVDIGRLDLSMDWRVCAVAIAAVVVTLLVAATLPMARSTRPRLVGELLAGPSSTTLASQRVRQTLLAFQVSATIVVLVAAGLFVRAVIHGFGNAPGFDVDRTVFVSVQEGSPQGNFDAGWRAQIAERADRLSRVLRALPGVTEVAEGISPIGPDATDIMRSPVTVKVHDREHQLRIGRLSGSPELLSVLGVPILAGRALTAADSAGVPVPAVITQSLAERFWPEGGALGQTFAMPQLRGGPYLVVGIARDLAFGSLTRPGSGVIVTARGVVDLIVSKFVVRTDRPEMVAGSIRRTIQGQVIRVETGRGVVACDLGRQRLGAWFFSGFGLAALLLGVGGAFGLVAYLAESQRREFGVRLALGADMGHLVRHGLVAALAPVSAGVAAGLVLAGLVSRVFTVLLAGISALDVFTYLGVAVIMLGCATVAALAAAWRLRRTSPSDALRAT